MQQEKKSGIIDWQDYENSNKAPVLFIPCDTEHPEGFENMSKFFQYWQSSKNETDIKPAFLWGGKINLEKSTPKKTIYQPDRSLMIPIPWATAATLLKRKFF